MTTQTNDKTELSRYSLAYREALRARSMGAETGEVREALDFLEGPSLKDEKRGETVLGRLLVDIANHTPNPTDDLINERRVFRMSLGRFRKIYDLDVESLKEAHVDLRTAYAEGYIGRAGFAHWANKLRNLGVKLPDEEEKIADAHAISVRRLMTKERNNRVYTLEDVTITSPVLEAISADLQAANGSSLAVVERPAVTYILESPSDRDLDIYQMQADNVSGQITGYWLGERERVKAILSVKEEVTN